MRTWIQAKKKFLIALALLAAGCCPCIMAMPEPGELSRRYADWLTIVGINSDTHAAWAEGSERHGVTWGQPQRPQAVRDRRQIPS